MNIAKEVYTSLACETTEQDGSINWRGGMRESRLRDYWTGLSGQCWL